MDLSDKLPAHYQLLDVAASTIEQAINSGGFYTDPKTLATVRSIHSQLNRIIANRTRDGKKGSTPEAPSAAPASTSPTAGGEGYSDEGADMEPM
jgi:hypothetical protein